jgi:hypothetical protein
MNLKIKLNKEKALWQSIVSSLSLRHAAASQTYSGADRTEKLSDKTWSGACQLPYHAQLLIYPLL